MVTEPVEVTYLKLKVGHFDRLSDHAIQIIFQLSPNDLPQLTLSLPEKCLSLQPCLKIRPLL